MVHFPSPFWITGGYYVSLGVQSGPMRFQWKLPGKPIGFCWLYRWWLHEIALEPGQGLHQHKLKQVDTHFAFCINIVFINTSTNTCSYMCIYVNINIYIYMYIPSYHLLVGTHKYVCMYIYIYISLSLMYIYIHIIYI